MAQDWRGPGSCEVKKVKVCIRPVSLKSWPHCSRWVRTSGQRREEGGSDVVGLRDTQGTLGTAHRRALASSEEV